VRLHPTLEQEELLQSVGDTVAKLINMENYRRRRALFEGKGIDYNWKSAWKRRETDYIEIYKLLGSVNFHETCRFISEMWRSFVSTLKAKKKGKLEPWQQVRPPGYRKREGQRLPIILVRFDNYKVDLQKKGITPSILEHRITLRWKTKVVGKAGEAGSANHNI